MRVRSAAAVVLAVALALTGCSDDRPDPPDPPVSAGTSSSPSLSASPSPTAAPREPALPRAATKATEAGARAFITYYWDLINYAQATGDVKALKRVSGRTCGGCNRAIGAVVELFDGGGRTEGGEYTLEIDHAKELSPDSGSAHGVEGAIKVRNSEQAIVAGDGSREVSATKTSRYLMYLIWSGDWRTDVLEPR